MSSTEICQTPFGAFSLRRYPARRNESLLAWCAADLLLLEEINRLGIPGNQTLVVNDEHGALTVALQPQALWTDSALTALATQRNLALNQRADIPVLWSIDKPRHVPALIALRVPKQLPYFEYQLHVLATLAPAGTRVLAAGMDKHLSPRVAELLERYIGPTERHRGQRKARLFSATRDQQNAPPAPSLARYYCEPLQAELTAMPNVFSQERLDGGSRLLLAQLPGLEPAATVVDLACGNGVLGLAAYRLGIARELVFADESAMALASARANAASVFPAQGDHFHFYHGDGLAAYPGEAAQLIVCNPPFHLNHVVDDYAGKRLLTQCAAHLQPGGRLCLVANRHLDYVRTLRRQFDRVDELARDDRFIVWLARRR